MRMLKAPLILNLENDLDTTYIHMHILCKDASTSIFTILRTDKIVNNLDTNVDY